MESPWESQRAEAENGELLSVEESDHEGERLVHKTTIETVKIHEGKVGLRQMHEYMLLCFFQAENATVKEML